MLCTQSSTSFAQISPALPQLGKATIKEVIAAMTLEEKASLVMGVGGNSKSLIPRPAKRVDGAAGATYGIPRLGIPDMVFSDGPAGVRINPERKSDTTRTYYATAFPTGTLLASTWNPPVVNRVGKAFGNEVLEYGIDVLLAPGVNIQRNPLNGRNFEYFSEDPLVIGKTAAAMINGVQSNGVGTSIKHFAANNQETSRMTINESISERAMRELYLRGFRIAIKESNPWTVMSSYNKINGTYTSERKDLLTTILRNEWHYKGFVMSDWGGAHEAIGVMNAGNDMIMPGNPATSEKLVSAVKHDSLDVKVLDQNVERILNIILKTPSFKKYKYSDKPDMKAHAQVSREAATEGIVLLKNDSQVLPLKKTIGKIALFGNSSYNIIAGGGGSGDVHKAYVVSLPEALKNVGYVTDNGLKEKYEAFISQARTTLKDKRTGYVKDELQIPDELVESKASDCDVAIFTIGRNSSEGSDRDLNTNYNLTTYEKGLIKKIADEFHKKGKKLIIVLNIGGVIDPDGWKNVGDATLLAWQPGQEGGNAIADVLTGKVNPSGKLAITFPQKYEDVPSAKNFPGTPANKPAEVTYEEGIYVGYRYYDSFKVKPAYEFGYGLSYTNFELSDLKLSSPKLNNSITITVKVKNTGRVTGKEVVQLYVSAPSKSIDKPMQELRAFCKTQLLQPSASQTITFTLVAADLASFHSDQSAWITDAGTYIVKAATSSRSIKASTTFTIDKASIIEKVNKTFALQNTIKEYKPN
jgi:beta-glucosidase